MISLPLGANMNATTHMNASSTTSVCSSSASVSFHLASNKQVQQCNQNLNGDSKVRTYSVSYAMLWSSDKRYMPRDILLVLLVTSVAEKARVPRFEQQFFGIF
jgi:hypothetical protein